MSNSQVLQFHVQYTYDAASLKQIQTALNNLEAVVKIRLDDEGVVKQLNKINERLKGQSSTLREVKKSLQSVQEGMKQTFKEGEEQGKKYEQTLKNVQTQTEKQTTATQVKQLDLFTQAQKQADEQLRQHQATLKAVQEAKEKQTESGALMADNYTNQASQLTALNSQMQGYRDEMNAIYASLGEGESLTDAQKDRLNALALAIRQTGGAYRDKARAIVENTQVSQQDTNTVEEGTRVLRESYSTQLQVLASYKSEITAISAQLKELDTTKKSSGQLTEQEKAQYEALALRLKTVKSEYTALQKEVQKAQTPKDDPAIIKQNERIAESQRKLADIQRDKAKTDDAVLQSYMKQSASIAELQSKLNAYKTELTLLQNIEKQGGSLTQEQSVRQEALKLAITDTNKALQQARRDATSTEIGNRALGSSYNDMRDRMAALSVQIRNTEDPLGKNREQVARMTAEYNELNTKLKTVDASMGNQQRNVGNYTESIRAAANALAVVQGPLGPLAGRLNSVATTINRINEITRAKKINLNEVQITTESYNKKLGTFRAALMANIPLISHTNRGIQAQAVVAQKGSTAIKVLSGTLGILKTALAATGIGALILGISALVSFFKRTEKGAQALRVIMAGVSAVVETLRARTVALGERIFEAFKNPKQAIKDLGNLIVQNLVNRAKGVADIFTGLGKVIMSTLKLDTEGMKEGAAEVGNALIQVTTGVEDAGGAFKSLTEEIKENVKVMTAEEKRLNALKVAQREMNVERAKASLEVQKARALARDATVSYEEQVEALERIKAAEEERFKREVAIAQERLDIAKEQLDRFPSDEKAIEELAQAEIEFANLKKEFFTQEIRLFRDIDSRKRAMRERENRELREQQKIREEGLEIARNAEMADLRRMGHKQAALMEERRFLQDNARVQKLVSEKTQEILNQEGENYSEVKAKERAEALVKAGVDKELAENYIKLLDLQFNTEQEMISQRASMREMERQSELSSLARYYNNRNDAVSLAEATLTSVQEKWRTERDRLIDEREEELYRKTQDRAFARAQAEKEIALQSQEEIAQAENRLTEVQKEYKENLFDTMQEAASSSLQAIFGESKAVASGETIIDTLKGAQRAIANTPGPIGVAQAAAIVAKGAVALRKINSTKPGDSSVSGAGGGVSVPKEAFGLVDATQLVLPTEIASQLAGAQPQVTNNIILEGELDSELLALKVRDGNNTISAQTVSV